MLTYMPICLHFKSTSYSRLLSIFKALEYHVMSLAVLFCQKYVRHHYHVFLFCAPTCPIYVLQHLKASECIKSPPRSPFLHSYSRHFYAITPVPQIEHESMNVSRLSFSPKIHNTHSDVARFRLPRIYLNHHIWNVTGSDASCSESSPSSISSLSKRHHKRHKTLPMCLSSFLSKTRGSRQTWFLRSHLPRIPTLLKRVRCSFVYQMQDSLNYVSHSSVFAFPTLFLEFKNHRPMEISSWANKLSLRYPFLRIYCQTIEQS